MKVQLSDEIGEVAFPPSEYRWVNSSEVEGYVFSGFDRNPYLSTFTCGSFVFSLVNCHSYFGGTDRASIARRTLETLAVARWTDLRRRSRHAFTKDVVALGDFNLPKRSPDDPIYRALTRRGLEIQSIPRSSDRRSRATAITTRSRSFRARRRSHSCGRGCSTLTAASSRICGRSEGARTSSRSLATTYRITGPCGQSSRSDSVPHAASHADSRDMLGLHASTAVRWVERAGGNWTSYASLRRPDRASSDRSITG